jgi:putative transposase
MRDIVLLIIHLAVTAAKLLGPGGVRVVVAENLLLKHELTALCRPRKRAPNLSTLDRLLFGFGSLFPSGERIRKLATVLQPSTLLKFHDALVYGKHRRLFSSSHRPKKPGPKGPSDELIRAIVELKSRNPRFGCPRIALNISRTFGIETDQNIVRRVLLKHYRAPPRGVGPSWLTFLGHTKDSLRSADLLRCAIDRAQFVVGIGPNGSVHASHNRVRHSSR